MTTRMGEIVLQEVGWRWGTRDNQTSDGRYETRDKIQETDIRRWESENKKRETVDGR